MLFTQFEFIFVFVPVTLIGYFNISRIFSQPAAQVIWLAAASLVFVQRSPSHAMATDTVSSSPHRPSVARGATTAIPLPQ